MADVDNRKFTCEFAELEQALQLGDAAKLTMLLHRLVPEFRRENLASQC